MPPRKQQPPKKPSKNEYQKASAGNGKTRGKRQETSSEDESVRVSPKLNCPLACSVSSYLQSFTGQTDEDQKYPKGGRGTLARSKYQQDSEDDVRCDIKHVRVCFLFILSHTCRISILIKCRAKGKKKTLTSAMILCGAPSLASE